MEWKNIEGYRYPYRINEVGEVQRVKEDGTFRTLKQYHDSSKNNYRRVCVSLSCDLGKAKKIPVVSLMTDAFLGGKRKGYLVVHRNGMISDCARENLAFASRKFLGKRHGGNGRHSVEKIDCNGEVVDVYGSVSEAAKKNHATRKSICGRCTGNIKSELYGYTYRYER